jgi:uncharacterized protein (DUF2384 family)
MAKAAVSVEHRVVDFDKLDAILFPRLSKSDRPAIGYQASYLFDAGRLIINLQGDRIYTILVNGEEKEYWVSHKTRKGGDTDILQLYAKMVRDLASHNVVTSDQEQQVCSHLQSGGAILKSIIGAGNRSAQSRMELCDKEDAQAQERASKPDMDEIFLRAEGEVLYKKQVGIRVGRYDVTHALMGPLKNAYRRARWTTVRQISEERYTLYKARLDAGELPSPEPVEPSRYCRPIVKWVGDTNPQTGTVDSRIAKLRAARESIRDVLTLIQTGLDVQVLSSITTLFGVKSDQVKEWLMLNETGKPDVALVKGFAVEHSIKLVHLYDTLIKLYKTPEESRSYLRTKNRLLNDRRPIDLMNSGYFIDWLIAHLEARMRAEKCFGITGV